MGGAISRCFWTGDNSRGSVTPSAGQPDSPQNTFPDVPLTPKVGNDACEGPLLRVFTYNELRSATRNFRPDSMLGEGGFGRVFKGWIDEHGTLAVKPGTGLTVAVKKLNQDGHQGHREWLAEVNCLGQLRHPNLVKLIGYCIEDDHRLLVYEFMPRGSLENHLFRKGALPLTWAIRMKVALCAAQGLAFLHGANTIYRDFKTSNILLDHDYTAKLSDFGLAKDGPEGDKTHVSTRIMGTYGYAAPEYVMTGHLTAKSDVYSFGVVLLEMLTGKRSMDKSRSHGEQNLVEWAKHYLNDKRRVLRLLDPKLEGQVAVKAFQKAAALARNCLSKDSKSRPLMPDVLRTLESLQVTSDITGHHQSSVSGIQNTSGVQQVANGNSNRYQSLPARQNSGNSSSNGPARGSGGSRYHQSPRASVNR